MKLTLAIVLALSLAAFSACSNKNGKPSESRNETATHSNPSDAISQKLQELAGSGATDCGSPKSQQPADVEPASKCALQAAQNKQPFYVRYDLPGMTTAMAGDAQGKLYAVQSEPNAGIQSTPCPAEIRQAQSGRVTCYAVGSMGSMPGTAGANPHAGASAMPPATGQSPHGGMMSIPNLPDTNPHQGSAAPSHGTQQPKKQKP